MLLNIRYRLSGFLKGFGFLYFLLNGLILIVMGIFAVHAKIKTNMSPGYIVAILPLLGVFSGYWMRIGKYGWWRILIIIISFSFSGAILLTAIFISPKLEQVKKEKFEAGKSIQQSNIDLSDVLIKAGADIHHRSKKGNTPLMFYSYSGYTEGIKYLIKRIPRCSASGLIR